MECREEGKCTGFQLQRLGDIKTAISSRSLNPLKTAPVPPPHLVADAAMVSDMHWLAGNGGFGSVALASKMWPCGNRLSSR